MIRRIGQIGRIGLISLLVVSVGHAEPISFNRDIRPILSDNCYYCHGQDANTRKADLRLDNRHYALSKEAFVPGNAGESELIYRILTKDPDDLMPPPDSNKSLTQKEKELLKQWINQGGEYEIHWAFLKPQKPALPKVKNTDWVRNPIDAFVLEKLEELDVSPSPEADKATLLKRLHADLIGLPPSPVELETFLNDEYPDAYEKVFDRLLASPHYGERMALPWLDAARYADCNGFQRDGHNWQWVWRDWVVKALNDDLPFDEFTIWQLASDLLPNATQEQKIATGFNRNHLNNDEGGAIPEEQRFVILFDRIETTSTT